MIKLIDGCTHHTISEDGTVTNTKTNHVKSQWIGANGYYHVDIHEHGSARKVAVHRLIAKQFIPNPEGKRTVNHIDGCKTNNSIENLEWATDAENVAHAYAEGLNYCTTRKISDTALDEVLDRFLNHESLSSIVEDYDFSLPTVSTYLKTFAETKGLLDKFETEKSAQKAERNRNSKQATCIVQMIDKQSGEVLQTFNSLRDAARYLDKKSSGPISNVLAGRQKSAYGYFWERA